MDNDISAVLHHDEVIQSEIFDPHFPFRTKQSLAASQSSSPVVMIERSLFSERYCFVQVS